MNFEINNYEYNKIIEDILNNNEFLKLDDCLHHKGSRLVHSKRVSLYSYKICKKLKLDYISAARGGLLHDFFLDSYNKDNTRELLRSHSEIAKINAKNNFTLSLKEENIIESHMFPVNFKSKPKYLESIIVSLVDKISCVYEKTLAYFREANFKVGKNAIYLFLLMFN